VNSACLTTKSSSGSLMPPVLPMPPVERQDRVVIQVYGPSAGSGHVREMDRRPLKWSRSDYFNPTSSPRRRPVWAARCKAG
jgi:hypothetical protein